MAENIYIQPGTVYYPGLFGAEVVLTIAKADQRYIKKGSDAIYNVINASSRIEVESTNDSSITSSSNCDLYGLHLHAVLASSTGMRPGCAISFNNSISDNVPLSAIAMDKIGSSNGELVFSTRNGSTCDQRLRISSTGVNINGNINCAAISASSDINCNGSYKLNGVTVSFPPALTVQALMNPSGNASGVSGYVWYTDSSRFYGARLIDANTFSLLNCSGGGVYNDALVYTHSASPTLEMPLTGSIFRSKTIQGLTSVETPLLDLRSSQTLQTLRTRMRWGGTANDNESWFLQTFNNGINSHFNIQNTTPSLSLLGFSFGIGSGVSNSDGTLLVLNGSQGDGNWINASSSNTNGALHLNCGIPQSVPAGWTFDSTGERSNSGGTVSVSLYAYNNLWIRGSVYCTSDQRLKNIIAPVDSVKAMRLLEINPVWYSWKTDTGNTPQLGIIAQELLDVGLHDLTHIFKNDSVTEADEEHGLAAGEQLVVSYERIPLYMLEIIKKLNLRLIKAESDIAELIDLLPKGKREKWDSAKEKQT